MWNLNASIIVERQTYLEEVLNKPYKCKEDYNLPQELIYAYIKNGTNLLCPKGTVSIRGQECLG